MGGGEGGRGYGLPEGAAAAGLLAGAGYAGADDASTEVGTGNLVDVELPAEGEDRIDGCGVFNGAVAAGEGPSSGWKRRWALCTSPWRLAWEGDELRSLSVVADGYGADHGFAEGTCW